MKSFQETCAYFLFTSSSFFVIVVLTSFPHLFPKSLEVPIQNFFHFPSTSLPFLQKLPSHSMTFLKFPFIFPLITPTKLSVEKKTWREEKSETRRRVKTHAEEVGFLMRSKFALLLFSNQITSIICEFVKPLEETPEVACAVQIHFLRISILFNQPTLASLMPNAS
jgi:hypothetical protein